MLLRMREFVEMWVYDSMSACLGMAMTDYTCVSGGIPVSVGVRMNE